MPRFEENRILPCSAEHVFDVVMDIEAYPSFLPWLESARILSQQEGELTAELLANFAGKTHPFTTIDRFIPHKLIEIRLLEGPFRFLESIWTFEVLGEQSCRVHFSIEFEFKNKLLSLVATPIFSKACRSMVEVFEARAQKLWLMKS